MQDFSKKTSFTLEGDIIIDIRTVDIIIIIDIHGVQFLFFITALASHQFHRCWINISEKYAIQTICVCGVVNTQF